MNRNPLLPRHARKTPLRAVLMLFVTALLAACGDIAPVAPIVDEMAADLVVSVSPAEAQVEVLGDAEPTLLDDTSVDASSALRELRYRLQPGSYTVHVTAEGHEPVETPVALDGASPMRLEVALAPEGEGEGSVGLEPTEPTEPSDPADPSEPGADPAPAPTGDLSLRGDVDFDVSTLSPGVRRWYERLWAAATNPNADPNPIQLARNDDEYAYARNLAQFNRSMLYGLRVTGDLAFLDEVDRNAQIMRAKLRDGWCSGYDDSKFSFPAKDGYLNWRRNYNKGTHYCRDVAALEETLQHAHIAQIMYAYHVNRDLESPAGVDYGERADFWLDYLQNHFEAKWRERNKVGKDDMDFIQTTFCHTHSIFTLYYYYVGKRLESDGDARATRYLDHARKMIDDSFELPYIDGKQAGGFKETSTPYGPALVYRFGLPYSYNSDIREACPTVYARYLVEGMLELHLEGFDRWASDVNMEKLANGFNHFVFLADNVKGSSTPFAAGVTGRSKVAGIPPTTIRPPLPVGQFIRSSLPVLSAWDDSGRIEDISMQVYGMQEPDPNNPRRFYFPGAMLIAEALRN